MEFMDNFGEPLNRHAVTLPMMREHDFYPFVHLVPF